MVNKTKFMKSYQLNKKKITNCIFLKKIKTLFFVIIFLNFTIWLSFHSSHHLFPKIGLDKKFEVFYQSHAHYDGKEHEHGKTSSPNHKRHQEQSDFDCLLLIFNYPCENFLITDSQKLIKNNYQSNLKFIFNKNFQIKKNCLNSELNPRAPPPPIT